MRIVPRLNEAVNEEWISDKARFQCDGLKRQRLTVPLIKGADGFLAPASWAEALAVRMRSHHRLHLQTGEMSTKSLGSSRAIHDKDETEVVGVARHISSCLTYKPVTVLVSKPSVKTQRLPL